MTFDDDRRCAETRTPALDLVGIVVKGVSGVVREPRTASFGWGGEPDPAPSLPFGRWKSVVRAA